SFIIHSKSASGYDASVNSTTEVDPELYVPNDSISPQQGMDEGTKNTSFDHISVASFIIHSKSASRYDASANSTTEVDPELYVPNDSISPQQGMDEGTKNTLFDHISARNNLHVLANQPQSISKGLETILTQPIIGKRASSIARQAEEEKAYRIIKLDDLAKLVSHVQPSFKNLYLPKDDLIIVVDDINDDEKADKDEVHPTTNVETKDASHKMELEKNKAEGALLKAQPSFPNVRQLNELLVKSLQTKFSKILSACDFSNSLPTKMKDLLSNFNELTEEVKGLKKQVHELEIELPGDLKEIPTKLEDFTKTVTSVTSQVTRLKTL
nr:hypothetical protein [Tanacetum cinerariifolium]